MIRKRDSRSLYQARKTRNKAFRKKVILAVMQVYLKAKYFKLNMRKVFWPMSKTNLLAIVALNTLILFGCLINAKLVTFKKYTINMQTNLLFDILYL